MPQLMNMNEPFNARPDVARAVAYAAPVWALGLLFLIALIVLLGLSNFFSLELSALVIISIAFVVAAAFEMMVRDLRRDSELRAATYRRMAICNDLMGGVRVAHLAVHAYHSAGMRQRAHMRSTSASVVPDDAWSRRRRKIHHR